MVDWYIDINYSAPESFHNERFIENIINIASPFMDYFCSRLMDTNNWTANDANNIFIEIANEMPIMNGFMSNGEFIIKYNKFINIHLVGNTKEIYRDVKISKILKEKKKYERLL